MNPEHRTMPGRGKKNRGGEAFNIRLEGVRELEDKLLNFGVEAWRRHLRRGFGRAARIMMSALKANAPQDTGTLAKSFGFKERVFTKLGGLGVKLHLPKNTSYCRGYCVIGPRSDFERYEIRGKGGNKLYRTKKGAGTQIYLEKAVKIRPSRYAHLTEGGTKVRVVKDWFGTGKPHNVGATPGKFWFKRSVNQSMPSAMKAIEAALIAGIEEEAAKQ